MLSAPFQSLWKWSPVAGAVQVFNWLLGKQTAGETAHRENDRPKATERSKGQAGKTSNQQKLKGYHELAKVRCVVDRPSVRFVPLALVAAQLALLHALDSDSCLGLYQIFMTESILRQLVCSAVTEVKRSLRWTPIRRCGLSSFKGMWEWRSAELFER